MKPPGVPVSSELGESGRDDGLVPDRPIGSSDASEPGESSTSRLGELGPEQSGDDEFRDSSGSSGEAKDDGLYIGERELCSSGSDAAEPGESSTSRLGEVGPEQSVDDER